MNSGFDENKAELGVFVLAVTLEVLADSDSLGHVSDMSPSIWTLAVTAIGNKSKKVGITFLINMYRSSGISGARPIM